MQRKISSKARRKLSFTETDEIVLAGTPSTAGENANINTNFWLEDDLSFSDFTDSSPSTEDNSDQEDSAQKNKEQHDWFEDDISFSWFTDSTSYSSNSKMSTSLSLDRRSKKKEEDSSLSLVDRPDWREAFHHLSPRRINCSQENIFAELAVFVEAKLPELSCKSLTPSPVKGTRETIDKTNNLCKNQANTALSQLTLFGHNIGRIRELDSLNKELSMATDFLNGRNMGRLMKATRSFINCLAVMDPARQKKYLLKGLNTRTEEMFELICQELSSPPLTLIVFLLLSERYPLYPSKDLLFLISKMKNQGIDVYKCYETLDGFLKKNTLTQHALEAYQDPDAQPGRVISESTAERLMSKKSLV